MKSSKEIATEYGGKIQIADNRAGGNSSWGEKDGNKESSIRLAWYNKEGGFDPISSAELPLWGLKKVIETAAREDLFSKAELSETIGYLTASLYRQA